MLLAIILSDRLAWRVLQADTMPLQANRRPLFVSLAVLVITLVLLAKLLVKLAIKATTILSSRNQVAVRALPAHTIPFQLKRPSPLAFPVQQARAMHSLRKRLSTHASLAPLANILRKRIPLSAKIAARLLPVSIALLVLIPPTLLAEAEHESAKARLVASTMSFIHLRLAPLLLRPLFYPLDTRQASLRLSQ